MPSDVENEKETPSFSPSLKGSLSGSHAASPPRPQPLHLPDDDPSSSSLPGDFIGPKTSQQQFENDKCLVYNFLCKAHVPSLRNSLKRYNTPHKNATKETLVASLLQRILEKVENENLSLLEEASKINAERFSSFKMTWGCRKNNPIPSNYQSLVLPLSTKRSTKPPDLSPRPSASHSQDKVARKRRKTLDISEFARLLYLMRDHDSIQEAIERSMAGMSRKDLENKVKPNDIWTKAVEPVFNDWKINPAPNLPADITLMVLPGDAPEEYWHGDDIKEEVVRFRPHFTSKVTSFRASGQSDPDFGAYLRRIGIDTTSELYNRLLMTADVVGIGHGQVENAVLFNMFSKSFSPADKDLSARRLSNSGVGSSDGKRRRRRSQTDDLSMLRDHMGKMGDLADVMKAKISESHTKKPEDWETMESLRKREELLGMLEKAAHFKDNGPTKEVKSIGQGQYDDVLTELMSTPPKSKKRHHDVLDKGDDSDEDVHPISDDGTENGKRRKL